MRNRVFRNAAARICLCQGYISVKYFSGCRLTLDMARQIVDERRKMGNYAPMPVLMNAMQLPWIDDEAMHYFISDEGHRGIAFLAVVTSNPLTVMALEGLIRLDKITYPCCHFAEEAEAIRWLKGLQATIPVNKNLQFLLQ